MSASATFLGGGALCGQWWRGEFFGTRPGYCLLDLAANGDLSIAYAATE